MFLARTAFAGRGQSSVALALARTPAQLGEDLALPAAAAGARPRLVLRARRLPGFTVRPPQGRDTASLEGKAVAERSPREPPAGFRGGQRRGRGDQLG